MPCKNLSTTNESNRTTLNAPNESSPQVSESPQKLLRKWQYIKHQNAIKRAWLDIPGVVISTKKTGFNLLQLVTLVKSCQQWAMDWLSVSNVLFEYPQTQRPTYCGYPDGSWMRSSTSIPCPLMRDRGFWASSLSIWLFGSCQMLWHQTYPNSWQASSLRECRAVQFCPIQTLVLGAEK